MASAGAPRAGAQRAATPPAHELLSQPLAGISGRAGSFNRHAGTVGKRSGLMAFAGAGLDPPSRMAAQDPPYTCRRSSGRATSAYSAGIRTMPIISRESMPQTI